MFLENNYEIIKLHLVFINILHCDTIIRILNEMIPIHDYWLVQH